MRFVLISDAALENWLSRIASFVAGQQAEISNLLRHGFPGRVNGYMGSILPAKADEHPTLADARKVR
jgi:hypothetical protein